MLNFSTDYAKSDHNKGPSTNYVSIFEGGGGRKMLTDAYMGGGGCFRHAYISILKSIHQKLGGKCDETFLSTPSKKIDY